MSVQQRPIVILGAGLTGLSAALHLVDNGEKRRIIVLEREQRVGGKARSERQDGYTFDVTGHWLHLRDPGIKALVERLFTPGDLVEIERRTGIHTHGVMLPYPFQANLFGLPLEVVQECLVGFLEAQRRAEGTDAPKPRTFEEFAIARFGEGIAKHFFIPYNQKLWGEHYAELTPEWVSRFVPFPNDSQVIGGAIGLRQEGLGYNASFVYPKSGGIDALPEALAAELAKFDNVELRLGASVASVDATQQVCVLADGERISYNRLVSTLPLPELIKRIGEAPAAVREAAAQLRWVRWRYLNVATRSPVPRREHWIYVPEPRIPFFRVGCFSNALPAMAPEGKGSLYVELQQREGEVDMEAVAQGLVEVGVLSSPQDIVFAQQRDIEYAYVVFDAAYAPATATIFAYLQTLGVRSCGRYGAWIYNSMEDSLIAGKEAAGWVQA